MPCSCLAARSQSSSNTDGGSRKRAPARSRGATRIGRPPSRTHCAPAAGQGNRARGTPPGLGMIASRPFEEQRPEPATRQGNAGHRASHRFSTGIRARLIHRPRSFLVPWTHAGACREEVAWRAARPGACARSFRLQETGDPGLGVSPMKCHLHWPVLAPNLIAWGQLPRRDQVWPTAGV